MRADTRTPSSEIAEVQGANGILGLTTTNIEADTKAICTAVGTSC